VHRQREGGAYNWALESVCYDPLFPFKDHGPCLAAKLRSGNAHRADDWDELLVPEIERQQAGRTRVAFRADAAFATGDLRRTRDAVVWSIPKWKRSATLYTWT
jgi:hypothetical protein